MEVYVLKILPPTQFSWKICNIGKTLLILVIINFDEFCWWCWRYCGNNADVHFFILEASRHLYTLIYMRMSPLKNFWSLNIQIFSRCCKLFTRCCSTFKTSIFFHITFKGPLFKVEHSKSWKVLVPIVPTFPLVGGGDRVV